MGITMTGYHHNLNHEGITESIVVTYSMNDAENNLNATVALLAEDMVEGIGLEDISKQEIDPIARAKIKEWV